MIQSEVATVVFGGPVRRALNGFDVQYTNGDHHLLREMIDASVDSIQNNTDIEVWRKDAKDWLKNDLDRLPKVDRLGWTAAGSTKKLKPIHVLDKQDFHTMSEPLTFIQQRAQADKGRAATLQKIHDRLAKLSTQDLEG